MVNIDTIYQRVLAVANKEQRGYITPQEFNLFANQAQMDIFEQYFYDVNQFSRIHGNETEFSDMLDTLNEKIDIFQEVGVGTGGQLWTLTPPVYKLGLVMYTDSGITTEVERVSEKEWLNMRNAPLTQSRNTRPVYVVGSDPGGMVIRVFGHNANANAIEQKTAGITCNYVRSPARVNWAYVIVNGYAQYNLTNSEQFELHPSEEPNLVFKILQLAGITIKDPNLYQIASQEEIKDIQQEKQ